MKVLNGFVTRDADIRATLLADLRQKFPLPDHDLILEEFGCINARIDVAVVNGALHGYEIKSDSDSIDRLESQARDYGKVFDFLTLVSGRRLLEKARAELPKWWGISIAIKSESGVCLREIRKPKPNPSRDAVALARMMWKNEALQSLRRKGFRTVTSRHSAFEVWDEAARLLELENLAEEAREAIRARGGSGFRKQRVPDDDLYTTESTVPHCHCYSQSSLDWLLSQRVQNPLD